MSDMGHPWGDRVTIQEPFVFRGFCQEPEESRDEEEQEPTKADFVAHVFNQTDQE